MSLWHLACSLQLNKNWCAGDERFIQTKKSILWLKNLLIASIELNEDGRFFVPIVFINNRHNFVVRFWFLKSYEVHCHRAVQLTRWINSVDNYWGLISVHTRHLKRCVIVVVKHLINMDLLKLWKVLQPNAVNAEFICWPNSSPENLVLMLMLCLVRYFLPYLT